MFARRFLPCIYLKNGSAVTSEEDDTIIEADAYSLAMKFCKNGADGIIIFDLSEGMGDEAHEESLKVIRAICGDSEVSVYATGNIQRLEDVKKLIYAGCAKVILDYDKDVNVLLTSAASGRFGRDKILAAVSFPQTLVRNIEELDRNLLIGTDTNYHSSDKTDTGKVGKIAEEYVSGILLKNIHALDLIESEVKLPIIISAKDLALNKMIDFLKKDSVSGVTGNVISLNSEEINSIKKIASENGIIVRKLESKLKWSDLKKGPNDLIPVIVQDYKNDEVLMLAYMNEEAFLNTLSTGMMTYYSRSREEQWVKGETSGHYQYVKSLTADCDKDTILAKVSQVGVACHTGARSCFFNEITGSDETESSSPHQVFEKVYDVIMDRKLHPKEGSYTNYLFDKGLDKILKKFGEEATEAIIASKNPDKHEIVYEMSDLLYHMMVLMAQKEITWDEITRELADR
ncbi:MAG: bifunctional phosphoribosyl-AMP cyclohydrolase/phosphoribosyl-ATP diphosphatase HisIE [Lachnospiraceae bacterium]|nr:bifunctional phosphoribosyl-AMP cyclohydrolase/phosphoribosyl-ATP diphosphatase HisIE [Lachnospiraceae bacterium]